jgi:flagellar assembly protein FliH
MSDQASNPHTQTAYQRWEMAPLGEARTTQSRSESPATARLSQEMARSRETGHQQGYIEGLEQGKMQGQNEGFAQGVAMAHDLMAPQQEAMTALLVSFEKQVSHARSHIAQQVLTLALDMAHAVLKSAVLIQPQRVLPLIEETLQSLPSLNSPSVLFLHPEDLELLKSAPGDLLKSDAWQLRTDPRLMRGGCRVETPSNEVDATLQTRWQRLQESLGQSEDWLMPF